MTKKLPSKVIIILGIFVSLVFQTACKEDKKTTLIKRDQNFNHEWNFHFGNIKGAEKPDFDDSSWRKLDLPHDFSVEDHNLQDTSYTGPFFKNLPEGQDVGYLRGGIAWYRKVLKIEKHNKDKQVYLHFDGVQSQMTLFVNGKEVGDHIYGYTPFYFNITPYLNNSNPNNYITIRVENPEQNSRWFAGAGIYRSVQISFTNPIHVENWGLFVTTPKLTKDLSEVQIEGNILNMLEIDANISYKVELISPDENVIEIPEESLSIAPGENKTISIQTTIENPKLWSLENPHLYMAKIILLQNGNIINEYSTNFGIRSLDFSAARGFLLNGKEVLLKGACMHHDNGLLGAAAFKRAEERRVQIMKDNGYNAIRTSHNPPSKAFLDACDRIGMLVIDETFDAWIKPKRPNDYHLYFKEWWKKDTRAMLLRDRNHPSIIMWSFGNEVQERGDSSGLAIAAETIEFIKSLDTSRPVTQAICDFWDNPGKEWGYTIPTFELLDVGGYNYQWSKYESDHEKFPERIIYGSESVPQHAFENWQLVKDLPYVIGDFVWTGMDYIGESGIGHASYYSGKMVNTQFLMPWPWYISWCGDIDIIGNKKPQSYYRDVIWGESKLELVVHEPFPESSQEAISFWGWPQKRKSWNWEGYESKTMQVFIYSAYPKVRLELNREIIGVQEVSEGTKLQAVFSVPYQKGELKAIGIENGIEKEFQTIKTTGKVTGLKVIPDRNEIDADRDEIIFIPVIATDQEDQLVPNATTSINVKISGEAQLLSAGSASPVIEGSLKDEQFSLYNGKGLIIVRSTGKSGSIEVDVETLGEIKASATIIVNKKTH